MAHETPRDHADHSLLVSAHDERAHFEPLNASRRKSVTAWIGLAMLAMIIVLSSCASQRMHVTQANLPWSNARQLVLVTTPDWNATRGTLRTFARSAQGWNAVSDPIPVVIGHTGAAWGIGLHPAQAGSQKHEGDGRSPAGVFALGTAFGYAQSSPTHLAYAAMDADDYCIDVDGSPLYNRIVNTHEVGKAAIAGSTEPMRRDLHADGDQRYKLGFVIEHNPRGVAGAGSCIFAHLQLSADSSTAGCTAMTEPAMRTLLGWLQPQDHPVFVLLPLDEYQRLQAAWDLPGVAPH
jgi:L,D-peptidoglycan transpeptidase YkuD (ErfK/YbiS/YcfS/YnhG family)